MSFLVPFDGSELAEAALLSAAEFGTVLGESVLAVTVVPSRDVDYAREKGWIDPDESFDEDLIVTRLREQIAATAPDASFEYVTVDRYAPTGAIAKRIRRIARDRSATLVFLGSENAGRMVTNISSVGRSVAADDAYDVVIVRNQGPSTVQAVREASPYRQQESGPALVD